MIQQRGKKTGGKWIPPLSIAVGLAFWECYVKLTHYPAFILPAPSGIVKRFIAVSRSGLLWPNVWATFQEVLLGLLFGTLGALIIGYILAHSPTAEKIAFPYVVISQAIPMAAIAPLMIIWFGSGMLPKVVICSLVVFFPVLINILVSFRDLHENYRDLMTSLRANRRARLRYLEIPGTLPTVLGGLRISATLSVLGAVVGELSGSNAGLGFLINTARGQFDTALVFTAVLMLMSMAIALYVFVLILERKLLKWTNPKKEY